jgi:molecular chaperone DnaJ
MMAPQREWFEKDYYKLLGVPETAAPKEITKAYRKLARELHPDANPGDAAAEERFKEVSAAYDVLGDEVKRKEYDEVRRLGPMAAGFGGPGGPGGPGAGGFNFTMGTDGLGDLLGGLFGRGRRGATGASGRGVGPQRGDDLEATLTLSFLDAARGIETVLQLTSDAVCTTCTGSGAAPGTSPRVCGVCGGRGVTDDNQGLFSFSTPCTACQGKGARIDSPCPGCRGTGVERRPREVKVRIPAGVDDAQRIRLKGRGGPGRNGGPAGDLFVECRVLPHPVFSREGLDVKIRVPITFAEAALGAEVKVPTLDGSVVTLRLKAGTQPGARQRVRGRGIATTSSTGDLLVSFDIHVPTSMTDAERTAVEALAKVASPAPRSRLEV